VLARNFDNWLTMARAGNPATANSRWQDGPPCSRHQRMFFTTTAATLFFLCAVFNLRQQSPDLQHLLQSPVLPEQARVLLL
jgi:hypothetical protein